jgi:hypothetical protein
MAAYNISGRAGNTRNMGINFGGTEDIGNGLMRYRNGMSTITERSPTGNSAYPTAPGMVPNAAGPMPAVSAPALATAAAPMASAGSIDANAYLSQAQPTLNQGNRFEAGLAGNENRLNALLSDPSSIDQSAAYKFRLGQGQEALQRQMAAKGMLGSGNRLMELTQYGQDMASQEYGNQFDRLKGLNDSYSQSWLGDKNANTSQFAAQSAAHGARGNLLNSLMQTGNTTARNTNDYNLGLQQNANQAQATANNYALGQQDRNLNQDKYQTGWRY